MYLKNKIEIVVESFRLETKEMQRKNTISINPANLDSIVGEITLDGKTKTLKISDGDLAWDTRRKMLEQYGRTLKEVAHRLERLNGAYETKFYNETNGQGASDIDALIDVIR